MYTFWGASFPPLIPSTGLISCAIQEWMGFFGHCQIIVVDWGYRHPWWVSPSVSDCDIWFLVSIYFWGAVISHGDWSRSHLHANGLAECLPEASRVTWSRIHNSETHTKAGWGVTASNSHGASRFRFLLPYLLYYCFHDHDMQIECIRR